MYLFFKLDIHHRGCWYINGITHHGIHTVRLVLQVLDISEGGEREEESKAAGRNEKEYWDGQGGNTT